MYITKREFRKLAREAEAIRLPSTYLYIFAGCFYEQSCLHPLFASPAVTHTSLVDGIKYACSAPKTVLMNTNQLKIHKVVQTVPRVQI